MSFNKPKCPASNPDAQTPVKSPTAKCNKTNPEVIKRGNITITVDREKHTITMTGSQEFHGSGATQGYADKATQQINNTWSGPTTFEGQPYTVTSNIQGTVRADSASANSNSNQINVVQTTQPTSVTSQSDPSNQPIYGRGDGHQHNTDNDTGSLVSAHEFGHSMGLKDEYTEGPRNPDGTRSIVRTGPATGLMGYIEPGSKPTADNFNSLITGCGLY